MAAHFASDPRFATKRLRSTGKATRSSALCPRFSFPVQNDPVIDFWMTTAFLQEGVAPLTVQRGNHALEVIGRLKDGATLEQTQADMSAIAGALATVSRYQFAIGREGCAASNRVGPRRSTGAADSVRRSRVRVVDRLRKRRKSFAVRAPTATKRDSDSHCARRYQVARNSPTADRKPGAFHCWRRVGLIACDVGNGSAHVARSGDCRARAR